MKIIVTSVVCLLVLAVSAYESYLPNSKHPDEPTKCYLNQTGELMDFGQVSKPIGICSKFLCRDDFVIRVDHCPRYTKPADCEVIAKDLTKSFPDCCEKLKCIDDTGKEVIRDIA